MANITDIRSALNDAQAFYRRSVRRSWVFQTLYQRNLADMLRPAAIGYAPPGWSTTSAALMAKGHTPETLVAAGISREGASGITDVMRDRMIFPVRDPRGDLVGFVGRAHADAAPETPKYLNSPVTTLYRKHQVLYGIESLTDGAAWPVIVEGPLDRLAMLKVIEGTQMPLAPLATCGTALTADHLSEIRALTSAPFVLAFDADAAGQAATLKAWDMLKASYPREHHRVIQLEGGADPADAVGQHRSRDLLRALATPVPLENHVAAIARGTGEMHAVRAAVVLADRVRADVEAIPLDHVTGWIQRLSQLYGLPVADVNHIVVDQVSPQEPATPLFQDPPVPAPPLQPLLSERRAASPAYRLGIER